MGDAAYLIITSPSRERTGNFFIDEDVLAEAGITDLSVYGGAEGELMPDIFLD